MADLVEAYPDAVMGLPLDVTDKVAVDAAVPAAAEFLGSLDIIRAE